MRDSPKRCVAISVVHLIGLVITLTTAIALMENSRTQATLNARGEGVVKLDGQSANGRLVHALAPRVEGSVEQRPTSPVYRRR